MMPSETTIHVAIELSVSSWLVATRPPGAAKSRLHHIEGGDTTALLALITELRMRASTKLGKPAEVVCCFEAGRDGFFASFAERIGARDHMDTSEQPQRAVKRSRWLSLRRAAAYISKVKGVPDGFALAVLRQPRASGQVRSRGYHESRYITIDLLPSNWQHHSVNIRSNRLVLPDGFVKIASVRVSEADLAWWLVHRCEFNVRTHQRQAFAKIESDRASENIGAAATLAVGTAQASGFVQTSQQ